MSGDLLKDLTALVIVRDLPGGRRKVGADTPLEMERQFRIRVEVGQPAPAPLRRLPADVKAAVDGVQHDLDAALLPALPAGGRDVDDRHWSGEGVADLVVEGLTNCHSSLYTAPVSGL